MNRTSTPGEPTGRADAVRQVFRDFAGPVFGLATPLPFEMGRVSGWERVDGAITAIRLVYQSADAEGPWVLVESGRWSGTRLDQGPIRSVIEHHMRLNGEFFTSVEWSHGEAAVKVEGEVIPAEVVNAGQRWWAADCVWRGTCVRVVAHGWRPESVSLVEVTDIEPFVRPGLPRRSAESPALDKPIAGEPHRELVEVVLMSALERERWLADGGPVPSLPSHWAKLWRETVARQMDFTDQEHAQAEGRVRTLTSHLTSLQREAGWFRGNPRLRDRAIAETLLHSTELDLNVASLPAQMAWEQVQTAEPREAGTKHEAWLLAWAAWAANIIDT